MHIGSVITATFAGLLATTSVSATGHYRVDTALQHGGVALGAPSLVVRSGEPGTIGITGPDGDTLTVTVRPDAGEALRIDGEVARGTSDVPGDVFAMVVAPGQAARLDTGTLGIVLTVTPAAAEAR